MSGREFDLDGLVARERDGQKVILPVWHGVTFDDVRQYSPMLADKLAVRSNKPLAAIVAEILDVLH